MADYRVKHGARRRIGAMEYFAGVLRASRERVWREHGEYERAVCILMAMLGHRGTKVRQQQPRKIGHPLLREKSPEEQMMRYVDAALGYSNNAFSGERIRDDHLCAPISDVRRYAWAVVFAAARIWHFASPKAVAILGSVIALIFIDYDNGESIPAVATLVCEHVNDDLSPQFYAEMATKCLLVAFGDTPDSRDAPAIAMRRAIFGLASFEDVYALTMRNGF